MAGLVSQDKATLHSATLDNATSRHASHRFELSQDTKFIYQRLQAAAPGETVTYSELADLVGRPCHPGASGYGALFSARKIAERDDKIVFGAVRKIGLKRLTDEEIVGSGIAAVASIRRTAKRGAKRVACADYAKLDRDSQVQHNAHLSVLGALYQATKPSALRRVETQVQTAQEQLPLAKTLEAFKK